jgi:hypothetical protein
VQAAMREMMADHELPEKIQKKQQTVDSTRFDGLRFTAAWRIDDIQSTPRVQKFSEPYVDLFSFFFVVFLSQLLSMGRVGSRIHSLQEPAYNFAPGLPAASIARRRWHAVTPDPHITMVCASSTPS